MMKVYFLAMVISMSTFFAFAQNPVKGKITDKNGEPMPGVTVLVQGTTVATVTNDKGEFEITPPANEAETGKKAKLVFSFIGMKTLVLDADADFSKLMLEDDSQLLNEVVAIGYGTQEKIDVTGSISTIKAKDIENQAISSYEQALQGRAAGLTVSSPNGELGAATRIRIRGIASLSASNDPLYVIDGFPVTSQSQSNFTDNNASNPLADLNPNDIADVQVLKDAAATAIYGSRGSNGVILITTKRGQSGKTQFNLNLSTGFSDPTNVRKFLNGTQYSQMYRDAYKNSLPFFQSDYSDDPNLTSDPNSSYGQDLLWGEYGGTGNFTKQANSGTNDDWNKSAYQRGIRNAADFNVNGGNEKTQFYGSIGYLDEKGMIKRNSMTRLTGRFSIDHKINEKFKFGVTLSQAYNLQGRVPENNSFGSATQANAIAPIISLNDPVTGDLNGNTFYANPNLALKYSKDNATSFRNISNIYANYNIFPFLTFRTEAGIDLMNRNEYAWNGAKVPSNAFTPNFGQYGTNSIVNWTTNNTLTFTKKIGEKHSIDALIGQSFQRSVSEFSSMQGQGLPSDDFQWLDQASQNTSFSSSQTEFTYLSYFSRLNYKFSNKYLLSVSARYDGSSRFGQNKQYGFFPGVSAGWIISEENFIKNLAIGDYLSLLKLKASIGVTGNSEISNFASRGLYNSAFFGNRGGIYPNQLANPNLTWETTTQSDAGIEFGFLKNRITGGFDLYQKNTNNLLLSRQIPQTSGFNTALRNLGKMETRGFDFYVNTRNIDGKFKWSTSFNISAFENKITDLQGQEILPTGRGLNAVTVGQPLGVFYGMEYAGVDPANGDPLYRLADGSTTNDQNEASKRENLKVLGNPFPKNTGGITNTFEYWGFDLSALFTWSYGNKLYNQAGIFQSNNFSNGLDNQTEDQFSYWRQPGDITNVPKPELWYGTTATTVPSSRWLSDGSFLRLRTVTLGYSLPQSLVSKIKLTKLRFYVTAQNLLTVTNYKGNDPEVNYFAGGASQQTENLTIGNDYYSAPQARTIIFGINVGF